MTAVPYFTFSVTELMKFLGDINDFSMIEALRHLDMWLRR